MDNIFLQFFALCVYVLFVGFCFCDGFELSTGTKIAWYAILLILGFYSLNKYNEFILALILPVPTLFALAVCWYKKRAKA